MNPLYGANISRAKLFNRVFSRASRRIPPKLNTAFWYGLVYSPQTISGQVFSIMIRHTRSLQ